MLNIAYAANDIVKPMNLVTQENKIICRLLFLG